MPKLLIVSPHFPPVNAPDMQRARMSLPHFVKAGWEVTVLTVDDPTPVAPLEPALLSTIPSVVRVVRAKVISRRWSGKLGVNNLGWRSILSIHSTARRLLRRERFDLVYFSTTQFNVLPLGRVWQREFGVPYVIDLQDPWISDFYERTGHAPPGGWKYRFAQAFAKTLEGWTLERCAHVISVSPAYLEALRKRYPWFTSERGTVLTFGAPDEDFAIARKQAAHGARLLPDRGTLKIAYAGRLGTDMEAALHVLFAAAAHARKQGVKVELFFFGTSYAQTGKRRTLTQPIAAAHDLTEVVHEHPSRIGYLDSLRLLLETDIALLLGSDDPAYSPSKTCPTLLAQRPTLAVMPAGSVLEKLLRELGGAFAVPFAAKDDESAIACIADALVRFSTTRVWTPSKPADWTMLQTRYSARATGNAQLALFQRVIASGKNNVGDSV